MDDCFKYYRFEVALFGLYRSGNTSYLSTQPWTTFP